MMLSALVGTLGQGGESKGHLSPVDSAGGSKGHLSPLDSGWLDLHQLQHLMCIERTKIFATRHLSSAQHIPKCVCSRGSVPDPAGGAYSTLPGFLSGFEGRLCGGEGRGEESGDRRKGDEGNEGRGWTSAPLQNLLRAPVSAYSEG